MKKRSAPQGKKDMSKRIVIDCSGLVFKSIFTLGDTLSYDDEQTGVIYGFLRQIFAVADRFESNRIVFCWDSLKSKRKMIYPEYKANRKKEEKTPEEKETLRCLFKQVDKLRMEILPQLGFKNSFVKTALEADDVIAAVVNKYKGNIVVSGDKDLYQLLDCCDISSDGKKIFTKNDYDETYGISCAQWAEAKAIAGCNSDNVIGVKGVADPAKSLKSKVFTYLKGDLKKGKVLDKIIENKEITIQNRKLVSLPFEEIDIELKDDEYFYVSDWVDVFDKLGFNSFLKKDYFNSIRKTFNLI